MNVDSINICHYGPEVSPERYVPEHLFMFLLKGSMKAYDGNTRFAMQPGDCFIVRKHQLIRFSKYKTDEQFEKVIITMDEPFLRQFLSQHACAVKTSETADPFLFVEGSKLLDGYIRSLELYYTDNGEIDGTFANIKREELLLILLRSKPDLADVLFNFGIPDKVGLEEYMNRNFRFNVSLLRFSFLTGRSLSSFKRDFKKIFGTSPGIWLKKKRLEEAYFQISNQKQQPSSVYLEVGFEDLSHFSYAFKKEFGKTPSEVYTKSELIAGTLMI